MNSVPGPHPLDDSSNPPPVPTHNTQTCLKTLFPLVNPAPEGRDGGDQRGVCGHAQFCSTSWLGRCLHGGVHSINEWIIRVLGTFLRPVLDQLIKRTREGGPGYQLPYHALEERGLLKKNLLLRFLAARHVGPQFPNQGSNPCPLQWKCGVLTTGRPGKSRRGRALRRDVSTVRWSSGDGAGEPELCKRSTGAGLSPARVLYSPRSCSGPPGAPMPIPSLPETKPAPVS